MDRNFRTEAAKVKPRKTNTIHLSLRESGTRIFSIDRDAESTIHAMGIPAGNDSIQLTML